MSITDKGTVGLIPVTRISCTTVWESRIPCIVEGIYGERRYLGEERKSEKMLKMCYRTIREGMRRQQEGSGKKKMGCIGEVSCQRDTQLNCYIDRAMESLRGST